MGMGEKAWTQTISTPMVSEVPVCKGSEIKVEFMVTSGSAGNVNAGQWFTASTQYQIIASSPNGNYTLGTKQHTYGTVGKNESLKITFFVQIPDTDDYQPGSDYRIQIISFDPEVISEYSNVFQIKAKPPSPTVSNNGPICEGSTIELTATDIPGATYNWTGPNGFTSTTQNPISPNAIVEMGGVYTVTATVDGCSSNLVSTLVQVNPLIANNSISNNQKSCSPFTPVRLVGSSLSGGDGNYSFLWESSTTGPTDDFTAAPGENTGADYQPENTSVTTWFRRSVTSGQCPMSFSNSVEIAILDIHEWTGGASTDPNWNNPSNWSCNTVPTLERDVLIPGNLSSGNYPVVSSGTNANAKDLVIETGAKVTITANWLRIAGDLQNMGDLDAEKGSISFEGTTAQVIPAESIENNRIGDLLINNASGVTSEGALEVTGILKVATGTFNTGNSLTLISSADKTALIDGSGMGEVYGKVTMQRYLEPAFGYKYFSSPFSGTVAGDFTEIDLRASFPDFYRYNENRQLLLGEDSSDATGWEAVTDPAAPINILEGYAINFGGDNAATVVELTGEVNNGSYTRNLENNNREFTRGFQLVGNPYPSPIDWDSPNGWTKTNVDNGIYFFTASGTSKYTGIYTSYVNGISSEDGISSNIIPSMQGFFVKVSDPAVAETKVTGSLTVNNSARIPDFEQEFIKVREEEQRPLLRLTAAFDGTGNKDAMVVYFSSISGTGFNKDMDAHKLLNTNVFVPNLYSISKENINLSINALPFPGSESFEKIPLGITVGRSGRMQIYLSNIQNIPGNWNIYLIDKENKIGQDLRKNPSYSFNIQEGEHNERFQLMFSREKISDPAIAFDEKFSVDSRGYLKVKLNLEEGKKGELRVNAVTGQLLEVKQGRGREEVEFRSITSSGIYFINLYVEGKCYSKKILVNK